MSGKAIPVPHRALRDVVLVATFLFAFPIAVTVTGALSDDGLPDRGVPIVERGAP